MFTLVHYELGYCFANFPITFETIENPGLPFLATRDFLVKECMEIIWFDL